MPRRSNRLNFLILTLTAFSLILGCSQPKDVISDVSSSRLTLVAERLPTLPAGMVYELWVTDINTDDISVGKFSYDQVNRVFLETDGVTPRSNQFTLEDDLFKQYWDEDSKSWKYWFTNIFISVENTPDDNGPFHGPIMLQDIVTNPLDDQMELRFQNANTNIGDATVRYNLESVSDGNRSTSSVGQGLWFTSYREVQKNMPDTIHFDVTLIPDTIEPEVEVLYDDLGDSIGLDTVNWDELLAKGPKAIISQDTITTEVVFGPDTLYLSATPLLHIGHRVEFLDTIDTVAPYVLFTPFFSNYDTVSRSITLDLFSQDEFGLPDYSDIGFHYKGWIVSTTAQTVPLSGDGTDLKDFIEARFTPPAWRYNIPGLEKIPGDTGALISTGTFNWIDSVDDGNPFVLNPLLVPDYPGEDFVDVLALDSAYGRAEKFDLIPSGAVNQGTVFITLEPNNFSANTNFPLIAFGRELPTSKSDFGVSGTTVQINMWNWTSTVSSDLIGFPQITVEVETF